MPALLLAVGPVACLGGGALRDGRPLGDQARLVSGRGGEKIIDGPYTEAKELVGGYFLLEGVTLEEATALGWEEMRPPAAAGPGT